MFYDTDPSKSSRTMLVEDGGGRLTYGEFERFYESVSGLLRPGTLMFLLCENSIGAVALYLTCLRRNVVPLLLERNLDRHLLAGLIGTYRPEYLAFPADMEERMCGRGGEGEHGPAEEAAPVASEETERFGYLSLGGGTRCRCRRLKQRAGASAYDLRQHRQPETGPPEQAEYPVKRGGDRGIS